MINIAICDDNKPMLDFLKEKVDVILSENKMDHKISDYLSGRDFLNEHIKQPFDVVFLDIVMPDQNGFEIAKQVRKISKDTYIIFVTTESSLVYESFDFQPFYFIPKSSLAITEEKLKYVVKKLALHIAAGEKVLINGSYGDKKFVPPNEILYIKSSLNNVEYHFKGEETQIVRGKLDDIEASLNQYVFARSHNRIIVNMRHIDEVDYPNMEIRLDNGEIVGISRGRKKLFSEAYLKFMRNFN